MLRSLSSVALEAVLLAAVAAPSLAQAQDAAVRPPFTRTQQRGVDYLLAQQEGGTFLAQGKPHLGVSALALGAVLTKPAAQRSEAEQRYVEGATRFVLSQQNEDGSFGESLLTYQTSAAVMALAKVDGDAAKAALQKAREFLVRAQNAEASGVESSDPNYGGFGYGPGNRGDLSNTQFAVEALRASGLPQDHEAFRRAISFLQRTQNLRSVNDFRGEASEPGSDEKFPVESGDDGGAGYLPGNSKFGFDVIADGVRVPRSYGSMTYALLKTYALCGLGPDDARVKAATAWIQDHWTVETNPGTHAGMGENAEYQGLFYYYETMARALTVCGVETLETKGDGKRKVAWRKELFEHLAKTQREDGSWLNVKNGRWWEDQPTMCTIYALLALGDCHAHGRSD